MILEGFKKINEEQITRVENTLNISFSLDYKDFILSNNGMCAEGELGIEIPLNQEVIAIDILYGIDTERALQYHACSQSVSQMLEK